MVEQLRDLYDAENRLVDALPKMADAASSSELKSAFENHLVETKGHVSRLESAFQNLAKEAERESCEAMKGLIEEGEKMIEAKGDAANGDAANGDAAIKDAAIIAAAQRVEHYEMAGYGDPRNFAKQIGRSDIADLLQQTLDEEGEADEKRTQIAESFVNPQAAQV